MSAIASTEKTDKSEKKKMPRDAKKASNSKSAKAGLVLPVSRVQKRMKAAMGKGGRVGAASPIYMTGALEYIAAEVLDQARQVTQNAKRKRITPADLVAGIRQDEDLSRLFSHVEVVVAEELKKATSASAGGGGDDA